MDIFDACKAGDAAVVATLLDGDKKLPAAQDAGGWRPLHHAAAGGHVGVIDVLLERGAKVDAKDKRGGTALLAACNAGRREAALRLRLAGADGSIVPRSGGPPLHNAFFHGGNRNFGCRPNTAELLIECGADVNLVTKFVGRERAPLHVLADAGWLELVGHKGRLTRLMLRHGADPDVRDDERNTPLHVAAGKGDADMMAALLDGGADVEAREVDGATPLFFAVLSGRLAAVRLLLSRGADASATRAEGGTPLDAARELGFKHVARLLQRYLGRSEPLDFPEGVIPREFQAAIEHGDLDDLAALLDQDPSLLRMRTVVGLSSVESPLHVAATFRQAGATRLLLARGAAVGARNQFGSTPLHDAAGRGLTEICRMLVDAGADVNAVGHLGTTPIFDAIDNRSVEVTRLLIAAGADVSIRSNRAGNPTPLGLALSKSSHWPDEMENLRELVRLLREAGAQE